MSRTLLSILAVLNNAVAWIISTCPLISKSSIPFNNLVVTVARAPIYYYSFLSVFNTSFLLMVSHKSLSDNKSSQVSRTLLSILAVVSNTVVWMISTQEYEWRSSNLLYYFQVLQSLYKSFGDSTKSTNYNWYYCHFHIPQLFQFLSKVEVLIPLFTFFWFNSMVRWDSQVHNSASSLSFFLSFFFFCFFFFCCWSSCLAEICWSVCISKSQRS